MIHQQNFSVTVWCFVGVSDSTQFCPFCYVMISLEQYRRAIGLYASRTGGLNKRHVPPRYMLRFVSVYVCIWS